MAKKTKQTETVLIVTSTRPWSIVVGTLGRHELLADAIVAGEHREVE